MIDLTRRFFIFGAAATALIKPARTFHILPPPQIIRPEPVVIDGKLFDLPDRYSKQLAQRLVDGIYRIKDIPRWVVLDQDWYDKMVAREQGRVV